MLEDAQKQLHLIQKQDRGLQDIELDHIRGSVGRYRDFTSAFFPRESHLRQRWVMVNRFAAQQGMPPIEAYQVGEAYFVVDGNHRVSSARQAGMSTIPAYVSEYKSPVGLSSDADLAEVMTKGEYVLRNQPQGLDAQLRLNPTGPAIGLIEDARFEEELIRTGSGDMLLMYTDGLVEATNRVEEMFGMWRLQDAVKGLHLVSPADAIREIRDRLEGFAGGTPLADDTTILAVRID